MKKLTRILIFVLLISAILIPSTVSASGFRDDKVIFGGNFTLDSGETLHGDLVVFGGNVILETSSTVNGDTVVMGGNVTSNGTINGNLVALGGIVELQEEARVIGDLTVLGSSFEQASGAYISGTIVTGENIPFDFNLPSDIGLFEGDFPVFQFRELPFVSASWFFFQVLIWTGLAVLVALFFQKQAPVVNRAAFGQPVMSIVVGLGITFIAPLVLIALILTILLSPVSLLGILALLAAWVLGMVSLSIEIGKKLAEALDQNWATPILAGIGMFILSLLFNGFQHIVPCVGFLPKFILGLWVTGAVVLTRFGTREYPEAEGKIVPAANNSSEEIPQAFLADVSAEDLDDQVEVNATKAALELAKKEGIDLTSVKGTGAEGRITLNDVRKAAKG
jgi:cytoskeletal protein CcmA (bactofilin family)